MWSETKPEQNSIMWKLNTFFWLLRVAYQTNQHTPDMHIIWEWVSEWVRGKWRNRRRCSFTNNNNNNKETGLLIIITLDLNHTSRINNQPQKKQVYVCSKNYPHNLWQLDKRYDKNGIKKKNIDVMFSMEIYHIFFGHCWETEK